MHSRARRKEIGSVKFYCRLWCLRKTSESQEISATRELADFQYVKAMLFSEDRGEGLVVIIHSIGIYLLNIPFTG